MNMPSERMALDSAKLIPASVRSWNVWFRLIRQTASDLFGSAAACCCALEQTYGATSASEKHHWQGPQKQSVAAAPQLAPFADTRVYVYPVHWCKRSAPCANCTTSRSL